jgi:hypothetical protein
VCCTSDLTAESVAKSGATMSRVLEQSLADSHVTLSVHLPP